MPHPPANQNPSVTIAGAATVAQAAAIRDRLASAIAGGGDVDIEVEATEFDVTMLQLLVSARRSLAERGGTLRLSCPPSGALLDALTQGGFIHHGGQDAVWTQGEGR